MEQHRQLPVPESGGRVPGAEDDDPQHYPHVRHPVANAIVPVRTGHAVPDRPGSQPRDQARPVLGDFGEQRPERRRSQRPVSEHQHVRVPRRDGSGAEKRVRERPVRCAVLHAIVRAHGETVRPLADDRAAEGTRPDQGGHVRTAAGRPTRGAHDPVLRRHQKGNGRDVERPYGRVVSGRLPRENQRGTGLLRQQRPGGSGCELNEGFFYKKN